MGRKKDKFPLISPDEWRLLRYVMVAMLWILGAVLTGGGALALLGLLASGVGSVVVIVGIVLAMILLVAAALFCGTMAVKYLNG